MTEAVARQKKLDAKPERKFKVEDRVVTKSGGSPTFAIIWGYEWSDGKNVAGKPRTKYNGWFYHVRIQASGEEFIIPETAMVLAR